MPTLAVTAVEKSRQALSGVLIGAIAVAAITLLLYPLREIAPAVSLGVVYLLAVFLVASRWGVLAAILTALASAAAFNFFHLPPTGRFPLADPEHWVSLAVLCVAALATAELAQRARRRAEEAEERRREADLSAEIAHLLLRGDHLDEGLATVGQRLARALELSWASIELGVEDGGDGRRAFPLCEGPHQLATLLLPQGVPETKLSRIKERIVPALESLLGAAVEREALLGNRVEAAALRRTDVLKTALLRSVSHDLRSPLTAIRAAAEPLRGGRLDQAGRTEMASLVIEESNRLSRLIENLLDLSRLEAGAAEPNRIPCDVGDVIHAAVEELRLPADAVRLQLADAMPAIEADPVQLQRAFVNLLENAHRHSGGHPLMVRASGLHNRVLVRVVDRGPGIPPAQRDRVFEPFYRSGTERTRHSGSGLGLAIVRGFVEANRGCVWVESLSGEGTSFVLEFPLPGVTLGKEMAEPEPTAGRT